MIRRSLGDTIRAYRKTWWRMVGLLLTVGILSTLAVWGVARMTAALVPHLRSVLVNHGHVRPRGVIEVLIGMAFALALLCLPILAAGTAAAVRLGEQSLSGHKPRAMRSLGRGLRRSPRLTASGAIGLVGFLFLTIASPFITVAGLLGLLLTPPVRLAGRRWPAAGRHWPTLRQLRSMAVPFAIALRWLAASLLAFPAITLGEKGVLPGLRRGREIARRRWGRVIVVMGIALLSTLILSGLFTWLGYISYSGRGVVLGQGVAQMLFIGLPGLALIAVFRMGEGTAPNSPSPLPIRVDGGTGGSAVDPLVDSPVLSGGDPNISFFRLWSRRLSVLLPITILGSLLAVPPTIASATSTLTMTVNSNADTNDSTAQTACTGGLSGCTLRAALYEAVQNSQQGLYSSITISFSGDMQISVGSPLIWQDSDVASFASGCSGVGGGVVSRGVVHANTVGTCQGALTIDGTGHTVDIDGGGAHQVFELFSRTWQLNLQNLEISNGSYADGAGVAISTPLGSTFQNDTFDHNTATDGGGAINNASVLAVKNSTFFDNTAPRGDTTTAQGGADIWNGGPFTVTATNDSFVESHGGSLFNLGSAGPSYAIAVNNSLFDSNDSSGAFYCTGSGITGTGNVAFRGDTSCPNVLDYSSTGFTGDGVSILALTTFANHPPVLPLSASTPGNPVNPAMQVDTANCPSTDELGRTRASTCDAGAYQYDPSTSIVVGTSGSPSIAGDSVTFTATVSMTTESVDPNGSVQFSIDGSTVGSPISTTAVSGGATATYSTSSLGVATHSVTAAFTSGASLSYSDSTTSSALSQVVNASSSVVTISSDNSPAAQGSTINLTITVTGSASGTPTGTIDLTDTSTTPTTDLTPTHLTLSGGSASYSTSSLSPGLHHLVASYSGDGSNHSGVSSAFEQDVQAPSSVSVTPAATTAVFGAPLSFTATVPNTASAVPTGHVTYTYTSVTGTTINSANLSSGSATFSLSDLPVGTSDVVSVQYFGDSTYAQSSSASSALVTITKAVTSTAVGSLPGGSVAFGAPVTLSATVSDASPNSTADPTGSVTFSIGSTTLGTGTLTGNSNGTATATYATTAGQLPVGSSSITATYADTTNFVGSTATSSGSVVVVNAPTSVAVTSAQHGTSLFGQEVDLTATVSAGSGSTATPVGTVSYYLNGTTFLGSAALSSGAATLPVTTLPVGTDPITASYSSTGSFNNSSTTSAFSQVVSQAQTTTTLTLSPSGNTVFGVSVSATITVAPVAPGGDTPTGTVQISDGSTTYPAQTLSGGQVSETLTGLAVGSHAFVVTYGGTTNYGGSTGGASYTVGATSTSTRLDVSTSHSVFGNPVTLTATVSNSGNGSNVAPSGSVTFYSGSTPIGTVAVTSTGATTSQAILTISGLQATTFYPGGVMQLTSSFIGSSGFSDSTSGSSALQVDPASTSVSVSASTTTIGVPTDLTATVSVTSGAGTPSGSVLFESMDGNSVLHNLGTITTSGGQAVLSGVVLPNGTVEVEAVFTSSDVDFSSAAPGILNLSLTRATPTLSAGLSPNTPMVYGTAYTLTGTLTVSGPAPTGTVTFTAVNGATSTTLGSASVSGTAPYTATISSGAPIPVGTQTITASYGGDTDYIPVSFDVTPPAITPAATTTSLSLSTTAAYIGLPVTLSAHVTNASTSPVPAGTVTFGLGTSSIGTLTVDGNGNASMTFTPSSINTFAVSAVYTPNSNFTGSNDAAGLLVQGLTMHMNLSSSAPSVDVGKAATFTAVVQPDAMFQGIAPSLPSGTVKLDDGNGDTCSMTVQGGGGPGSSTGNCNITFTKGGTFTLTATYAGDAWYAPTTATYTIVVGKLVPTITLTSPTNPWLTGQPVTYQWTITGPTKSDGAVTLLVGTTTACTTTQLTGSCSYTFPDNYAGSTVPVDLIYAGNDAYGGGRQEISQTVGACVLLTPPVARPAGAGTVTVQTPTNCGSGATAGYATGTQILLQETVNTGWTFQEWASTGHKIPVDSLTAGLHGPMVDDALYNQVCNTVTIGTFSGLDTRGIRYGRIIPSQPNCGAPAQWQFQADGTQTAQFTYGSSVTLTPSPPDLSQTNGAPYVFANWYGQDVPTGHEYDSPLTLQVKGPVSVSADFALTCYHGVGVSGPAGVTTTLTPSPNCFDRNGSGYAWGTKVHLTAQGQAPNYFRGWTGGTITNVQSTATGSSADAVISASNTAFTATYGGCVQFSVAESGVDGQGNPLATVSADPTGNCPSEGTGWYTTGSTVTIHTKAVLGNNGVTQSSFVGWSGPLSLAAPPYLLDNSVAVGTGGVETAVYSPIFGCEPLTEKVIPAGAGTIATTYGTPNNGNCPAGTYDMREYPNGGGSSLSFTLTAKSGNPLLGWDVATARATADGGEASVGFNGIAGATFGYTFLGPSKVTGWVCEAVNPQVTLISPNGTSHTGTAPGGTDFVDATPPPSCPLREVAYPVGTKVTPLANEDPTGYTFKGWSGASSGTSTQGTPFTLDGSVGSVTLTATYQVVCHTLTSNLSEGVEAYPAPNCPDTDASKNMYVGGTRVLLHQTGHSGDDFSGWNGPASNSTAATGYGTSGSYAWTTMPSDVAIYANYTAQTVGEKISNAFSSAGDAIAISAKKVVGVVAAAAGGILLGVNPVTAVAGLAALGGTAVSAALGALGVHGAVLDGLNEGIKDVSQTLSMLTAALTCGTAWSANANSGPGDATSNLPGQVGNLASQAAQERIATSDYNEELAAQESAAQAAAEQPYALVNGGAGAAITETAPTLSESASALADKASLAINNASKWGSRLGVVGAVGVGIYQEATSGTNTGWDASASAAWTGGGDVYNACVDAAEPDYFK